MTNIVVLAVALVVGISMAKKLFKLGLTVAIVALLVYGLNYLNIIHL